ncbi:Phage XkdN-like tail assembly chaperone protein, TAC [Popillia japonica]|uniref:Phage XkdN-like tail assembly chaperone protein, TAC n=1 Tax=Popillia japonica TaxID=7064 RepID=A0AAW1HTC6_POPJA
MSRLDEFLALPDVSEERIDIYVNERLGTFKIKPMSNKDWSGYRKQCMGKIKKGGTDFDSERFNTLIIAEQTVEPNFRDAAFLEKAGCNTAREFIERKFLAGEIADIAEKITKESGFDSDINEDIEEAKN